MILQELIQQLRDYYKDTELVSDLDDFNEPDEQGIDIYINNTEMLKWSEDLYNQWIDFVQNYRLDGEGYGLVFNTDGSGYNYWIKNQEETPNLSLVVEIDDLSKINTDKLLEDINTALQQYDDEETRLWQLANEIKEDVATLTDKIDKADSDLEELLKNLTTSIHEALEEKTIGELKDEKLIHAGQLLGYGFNYDKYTPNELKAYIEKRLKKVTDTYVKERFQGALDLIKEYLGE